MPGLEGKHYNVVCARFQEWKEYHGFKHALSFERIEVCLSPTYCFLIDTNISTDLRPTTRHCELRYPRSVLPSTRISGRAVPRVSEPCSRARASYPMHESRRP
jgi:hypothetical protein